MDKELQINLLKTMVKIRYFEETVKRIYSLGQIPGSVHLYTGEEAIATGACAALNPEDYISSTHRGHGHIIAKGGEINKVMAELFGKSTGYNGGRGGSMHIATMDLGILGANSIVGAGIPIATGAALSSWLRKSKQVSLCFFGDGASNQGTFHESLNIAANFKLPIVYICENNLYAVGTSFSSISKIKDISIRSKSYGMPGITIDGNEVLVVYDAVKKAVNAARNGEGPTLIECKTYRWNSHFEGGIENCRTKEEINKWKLKDPIKRYENFLLEEKIMAISDINKLHNFIREEIDHAVDFAKSSPAPLPADAIKYVTL